jgi:hypothetical protein
MRVTNEEARARAFNMLTRLMISSHDFQEALSAATFLVEEVDQSAKYPLAQIRRFRCYETAMVIAYARPFSMAKGAVGPLKWKDTGLRRTVAEKSLHEKLMGHRNTVYGHSDAEFVEMRVMVLRRSHDHDPAGFDFVMPRFDEGMRYSLAEVGAIHQMLHKLVVALVHEIQRLGAAFKDRFTTYELGD